MAAELSVCLSITAITLGHKTIESVRVLEDGPLTMYFVLADFVRPTRKRAKKSAAGLARAAKRHQKSHPGEAQSFSDAW